MLRILLFALITLITSCADYPPLDLSIKHGDPIIDERPGAVVTEYQTVIIGKQVWMTENLNYKGEDGLVGKCYDNLPSNCEDFGRLYYWEQALGLDSSKYGEDVYLNDVVGICPTGWHIPTKEEWDNLLDYVGLNSGMKLKANNGIWKERGKDEYSFNALPGGTFWNNKFDTKNECAYFWTSKQIKGTQSYVVEICEDEVYYISGERGTASLASIRCIKD